MSHLLGIDVGTGGTRAIVIDTAGRIVGSATDEHVPFASPQTGWAEQDPRDWWRATCGAVRAALAAAQLTGDDITAIGFSGQMHGSVLLDDAGRGDPPRAPLVRPADRGAMPGDHRHDRRRAADRTHVQPGAHRLHAAEAAVGA